ncbi:MAG: VWA domain-containing protein [Spirochaetaceae bacterium]|nr:MAG: VWA domain-containing protein [Spirochaetaceae bacterium]
MKTRIISMPALLFVLSFVTAAAFGYNVRLSQIDASRLLLSQTVRLYVSVTDDLGIPVQGLGTDSFTIFESPDGKEFERIEGLSEFKPRAASAEGITFLLLLDNSGSMYDTMAGRTTEDTSRMRITHAKNAVRTFLGSMTQPKDTVGLGSYNTSYTLLAEPSGDKSLVVGFLEGIERPDSEQAYTELYASLTLAVEDFEGIGGRRAIVILSDGENYPYLQHAGNPHPEFGDKIYRYTEPIQACQEVGISVYAVNFADQKDPNLEAIAVETGGTVFDARSQEELARVYQRIHEQVAGEYLIGYRATMAPAEKKFVRVQVEQSGQSQQATRFYFSSTVFGLPMAKIGVLLIIPFVLAFVLLWLISLLKFEKKRGPATLEVLKTRVGRAQTRVMPLSSAKTVIGGSRNADLTIVGNPSVKEQHATVIYDAKSKAYTVVGSGDLTVNNQPVKTKVLEPGDVIDVGGATIVFDDGEV